MLLLCKECHWSTLIEDDEVTLKGGPRAFRCGACQSTLDTLAAALGVEELSTASEAADMMSGARHTGPILTTNEISGSTLADVDGQSIVQSSASAQEYLAKLRDRQTQTSDATDQVEAYTAPPGQVIIGQSSSAASRKATAQALTQPPPASPQPHLTDPDATHQEMTLAAIEQNAMAATVPQRSSRSGSQPMLSAARSTSVNAQVLSAPASAQAPAPKRSAGRGMGLMLGCALLFLTALLGATGVGLAIYFSSGDPAPVEDKDDAQGATAEDDSAPVQHKRPPERAPLGERIHDMVRSHSGTSVPTIHLPGQLPNEAEAVLMTPNGVVYNGEMTATVSVGRVALDARPAEDSPFITPLARKLEATYDERIRDAIDAEAEPRWVVAVGDSTVPYSVVYSTLYTSWERGARLQLAATNPNNPSTYVTIDVLPSGWPAPIQAYVPDDLPEQNPALTVKDDVKVIAVEINSKGFTIRPPGDEEPVKIEKVTTWPVQRLRKEVRAQREAHKDIATLVIHPREKTKLFTLLQTIGSLVGPWKETADIAEIRLAKPPR